MEKNQNDKSNQSGRTPSEQSGSKSHQEQTQDGKKKTETNPNNPVANKYQGSPQDKQKHQESTSSKSGIHFEDTEESEEDIHDDDETPYSSKNPDSDSSQKRK